MTKVPLQNYHFSMQKIILQKIKNFVKILWPGLCMLSFRHHCFLDIIRHTSKGFRDNWNQVNNMQSFTDRHLLKPIN